MHKKPADKSPEPFEKWLTSVPPEIRGDSLWKVTAYQLALFSSEIGWRDVTKLARDRRTRGLADQLFGALGSIAANISEGYSRGTGRDRARFYEYALGSARESRTWYYAGRHVLGDAVTHHRIKLLTRIIQLLLKMVPQQRGVMVHEGKAPYDSVSDHDRLSVILGEENLLNRIP